VTLSPPAMLQTCQRSDYHMSGNPPVSADAMLNLEFTAVYSRFGKKDSENFETLSDAFAYLENGSDEGWIYAIGIFNSRSKLYWLPDSEMYKEINSNALIEFAATKFEQHDLKYAVCEN